MLNWHTLCGFNSPKFTVKGTELSVAVPDGCNSRFAIYMVRRVTFTKEGNEYDIGFYVRDAHTVSDDDVKRGIRPKIVGHFESDDEALDFIRTQQARS